MFVCRDESAKVRLCTGSLFVGSPSEVPCEEVATRKDIFLKITS